MSGHPDDCIRQGSVTMNCCCSSMDCRLNGCINARSYEKLAQQFPANTGWTCPRCGVSYSPTVRHCDCGPLHNLPGQIRSGQIQSTLTTFRVPEDEPRFPIEMFV